MNYKQPLLPVERDPYQTGYGGYPPVQHDDLPLSLLAAMLRRQRWVILALLVLSVGLAAAYTRWLTPVYEASSTLRFEKEQINLPLLVQQLSTENRIGTEIEVLQQRSSSLAVIDSLGLRVQLRAPRHAQPSQYFSLLRVASTADTGTLLLRSEPDGKFSLQRSGSSSRVVSATIGDVVTAAGVTLALRPGATLPEVLELAIVSPDQAARLFASALTVSRPARDADLITVTFRSSDRVQAAAVANLLTAQVISGRQQVQLAHTGTTVAFLRQQLDTLGLQLRGAEDALRSYRERAGVVDVQEQARTQVGRLAQLQADRGAVEAERAALAALLTQVADGATNAEGSALSRRLIAFPTLFRNQAASELLGSLARVENDRAGLLMRRTVNDPDVRVLTARIDELDSQLRGIAEAYLQGLTNQVASLGDVAKQFGGALDSLPAKEVQAARLQREVRVQQELFTLIQTRLKEAEITRAMDDPSVRVVDVAVVAERPVKPKLLVNLALALGLGGMLGIGVALTRELTDHSVRSRADAMQSTGLPILGAMPRLGRDRRVARLQRTTPPLKNGGGGGMTAIASGQAGAKISKLLVTRSQAPAGYIESFSQLQVNLAFGFADRPQKVLVFTSPLPGEGKTLTSVNFALTLAGRGQRVLLIDGDLRCGLVNDVFGVPRGPGFSELLRGEVRFEDASRRIPLADGCELTILPTGAREAAAGQLLQVERVRKLLGTLSMQFDRVIIDSPPVNLLADAALLGAAADAVVLVVRAGHTRADTLRYAMEQLTSARAPVIGTLLNDIDPRRHEDDQSYRYLTEVERYSVAADGGWS